MSLLGWVQAAPAEGVHSKWINSHVVRIHDRSQKFNFDRPCSLQWRRFP